MRIDMTGKSVPDAVSVALAIRNRIVRQDGGCEIPLETIDRIIKAFGPRQSNFMDVGDFHAKFGLPTAGNTAPTVLAPDVIVFRARFLLEELAEFFQAVGMVGPASTLLTMVKALDESFIGDDADLPAALDALCDLNYVSLGTAHLMGLPFDEAWAEVQRANMSKERATSADDPRNTRPHALNVVKPEGWKAPDHEPAIVAALAAGRSY